MTFLKPLKEGHENKTISQLWSLLKTDLRGCLYTITARSEVLLVITALLPECFVFCFACSISEGNNPSLFMVWLASH